MIPPVLSTLQSLNYLSLGWDLFEHLCKRLFALKEPQASIIRLYLSRGHKQHGIDGYAYDPRDQKTIHFQSKREQRFSATQMRAAVNEFAKGKLKEDSKKFVLCVSANITGDYEDEFAKQRRQLARRGIEFEVWDQLALDTMLKDQPQLVYEFFDACDEPNWTKAFCGQDKLSDLVKPVQPRAYAKPAAFVQRLLHPVVQYDREMTSELEPITLTDLLRETILASADPCRLFMRSEAGMGKSTELQYAAHALSTDNLALIFPVLLPLKNYVASSLPDWLDERQPGWRQVKQATLLLLIDGLDEVKTDEREPFIRRIQDFIDNHPECHVVISCRTNFANQQLYFKAFISYDLRAFQRADIIAYIDQVLIPAQRSVFMALLERPGLANWLANPFSLVHFVGFFQRDPSNVPQHRVDLLRRVAALREQADLIRYHRLAEPDVYRQLLRRIAFVMNLLGVNSLDEDQFTMLLPDPTDRERARQSALLQVVDGRVCFEHNTLQEYYAALMLSRLPVEQVRNCITFYPDYQAVKPKWYNTIGLLLELLPDDSPLFASVVDLIAERESRLLLDIEHAQFTLSLRTKVVTTILNSSARQYGGGIYYDSRLLDLAAIQQNVAILLLLIEKATSGPAWLQRECFFYLGSVEPKGFSVYADDILEAGRQALQISDEKLQETVLLTLAHWRIADNELQKLVTTGIPNLDQFDVRDAVYRYLTAIQSVEAHLDFFLHGFSVSVNPHESGSFSYTKLGPGFIAGLGQVAQPHHLHKILHWLTTNFVYLQDDTALFTPSMWEEHDPFVVTLLAQTVRAYGQDHSLLESVLDLCLVANQHWSNEVLKSVTPFFDQTHTREQAVEAIEQRIQAETNQDNHHFVLVGWLVTQDRLAQWVHEFEVGHKKEGQMWDIIHALGWAGRHEEAERFRTQLNTLGQHQFTYFDHHTKAAQREQRSRDLLLDKQAFILAVEALFDQLGSDSVTEQELINWRSKHYDYPDELVYRFLLQWYQQYTKLTRSKVRQHLEEEANWHWYLVGQFLHLREVPPAVHELVEHWFYEMLPKTHFRTALLAVPGSYGKQWQYKSLENRVGQLIKRTDFRVDEATWLDLLSFDTDSISYNAEPTKPVTLIRKVLQHVTDAEKIDQRIVDNLQGDFSSNFVLRNHLLLCRQRRILAAKPRIKQLLLESDVLDAYDRIDTLTTFIAVGGQLDELMFVFRQFTFGNEFHWHLLTEFAKLPLYEPKVGQLLLNQIKQGFIPADDRRTIILLLNLGFPQGLDLFAGWVRATNIVPTDEYRPLAFSRLPADHVAECLLDLVAYCLGHDTQSTDEDPTSTLLTYLKPIAFGQETTYQFIHQRLQQLLVDCTNTAKQRSLAQNLIYFEREYYLQKIEYTTIQAAIEAAKDFACFT